MDLTMHEVHYYNDLVKKGIAQKLVFPGVDDDAIVIPGIDQEDRVYFLDLSSKLKIYPGVNTIEKIKKTLDNQKKNDYT